MKSQVPRAWHKNVNRLIQLRKNGEYGKSKRLAGFFKNPPSKKSVSPKGLLNYVASVESHLGDIRREIARNATVEPPKASPR